MGENMMDCSDIRLILPSGKQLIVCFQILGGTQATLGLDLYGWNESF